LYRSLFLNCAISVSLSPSPHPRLLFSSLLMSLFCHLRSNLSSLNFYSQPDLASSSHHCSQEDLQPDDYLLCIERDGIWFHCHTRNISGWILGNTLQPASFPCAYIVNDELPIEAQIRLRTKPSDSEDAVGSIISPGTIIYVLDTQGNWLRINYQGREAWLKREVNEDLILAIPIIPKLYEKGSTLPSGCSLRLRNAPQDDGTITRLSSSDHFLGVQCKGNWIQVISPPHTSSSSLSPSSSSLPSPEWMLRKTADGTILLQESKKRVRLMCLQQDIAQEAILRIRDAPEAEGAEVGDLTYWDIFPVWFMEGIWAYTLTDMWEGFVLSASGKNIFLQSFAPKYPQQSSKPFSQGSFSSLD
jgi:hypothetical protein